MSKIKSFLIVLAITMILAVVGLSVWQQFNPSPKEIIQGLQECLPLSDMASKAKCDELLKQIQDFNTCVLAGFPVMESYPRQCRTVDGRLFIENIKVDLENIEPTNFSKTGVIVQNNPGLKPDTAYLVYEEPGSPAISRELAFDALSLLVSQGKAISLIQGKTGLEGQKVALEGIEKEGKVLVRKIEKGGEAGPVGSLFISWAEAIRLLDQCLVEKIMQTHALDVYLTLKTGEKVRAVEPAIDDVFAIQQLVEKKCGRILLGTE